MANENTCKIIDIRTLIQHHMEGHIGEVQLLERIDEVINME